MPNLAPSGTNTNIFIPRNYLLRLSNFGFSDTDGNSLLAVRFTTLPTAGTLYYDANGALGGGAGRVAITAGQVISAADIAAGRVTFVAALGASGANYASLTFQVQDNGGTAGGGIDLDASANTLTFGIAAGSSFGTLIDLDPANFTSAMGFKIQGDVAGDNAGWEVSSAGDVNGDGLADLIVGASSNDSGGTSAGAAYVIFGKASGFGTLIDLDPANFTSAMGFKIQGDVAFDNAGSSVSSAGDVNGDGFADVIVGARGNDSGGTYAGAAYVIFGKASGFGSLIDLDPANFTSAMGFKIQGDVASDQAGWAVSSAGDVNGDGFADVIVGARFNDSGGYNAGAAYVIFGKASGFGTLIDLTGLSATNGFKIQGDVTRDDAGISVSSAGDVNGDGFADLIVGAHTNSSGGYNAGAAYVIFGKASGFGGLIDLDPANFPSTLGFKIQGDAESDGAGYSISSAGDVNGDGFADVIVGARENDSGGNRAGAAYVIFGKASGFGSLIDLDPANFTSAMGFKIQGDVARDYAGISVSSAGDVNGDGFADLIVGVRGYDSVPFGTSPGAAYVIFGKASGFGSLIDLTGLSASDGFRIQGDVLRDFAGRSVSSAGDVNGDGFADLIVGARFNDSGGSDAGAAYVIFGHATPLPNTAPAGTDASISIPRNYALRLSNFGFSDTDGNSLLAVRFTTLPTAGTLYYDANGALGGGAGRVAVTAGQVISAADIAAGRVTFVAAANATGTNYASLTFQVQDNGGTVGGGVDLDASANTLTFGIAAGPSFGTVIDLDPANFPSTLGFKIQGDARGDAAGFSVSLAGDVNGDGFADILVGARNNSSGGTNAGAAYVIFGKASGFGSLIDLTGLSATDGFRIQGDVASDIAGVSVSSAGDVNGDGFADLIVGALGNDSGGHVAGAAYVIFGKASGFGSLIDLDPANFPSTLGFKIQGDALGDIAGVSVSSAGDVNGDGFADIIVGASGNSSGGNVAGAAYVIFGKASGFGSLIDLTGLSASDGFKIQGDVEGDQAGISVSSAGDVNGDGFADLIVGAYLNDSGGTDAGAAYVIFGKASGFGSLIDLTGLSATDGFKIQGDAAGDGAGRSVSSAGDVNGDGFADLIVGARYNDSGGYNAGAAYVIFGKASGFGSLIDLTGLSASDGFKIQGDVAVDRAGVSVSSAGDVNGDGFADLIVGVRGDDRPPFGPSSGAAYVIFGKASGFGNLIDLTGLSASDGFRIQGDNARDFAGSSVSSAGDVNGDGFADILVGAYGNDRGAYLSDAGAAYVIFGHATPAPNIAPAGTDATLTINEDTPRTLTAADFGFSDTDGDSLLAVRITTLPTAGTLTLSGNAVAAGDSIPVASLPNLVFTPAANATGAGYASFTFQVQDNGSTADGGVDLDASANTLTFDVTAVDDAPVAVADPTNAVDENVTVSITVLANDTDADGGTISVATINGSAATVGNAITLASGATATLNADGTISYNPNSRFNSLVAAATATATGATNSSATDSFSYALNGGSSATVTVTINGVDGAGDQLGGSGASDTLTGSGGNDVFNLSQGGDDTTSGGTGNDGFYFGAAFDGNDSVDGGAGTLDQLALQGDYSAGVTLGANSAVGVEQFVLLPGSDTRFGLSGNPTLAYNIITGDAAIAAGQRLVFQANTLCAGESFTLDASGELDGSVFTYGGLGSENLRGSQNADSFFFGTGRFNASDVVDGQGGVDQLGLQGTYSGANAITFGAGQLLNIEMIVCLSNNDSRFGGAGSGTPYSYTLTMHDANVAVGATLTISANNLASDETLTFDGSAELDGRYTIFSGNGADSIIGGALGDTISGRGGADNLTGGGGNDVFLYTNLTDSIATAQDHILDFTSGDVIDLGRLDAITGGANNAFAFIGDAAFGNTAGQLRTVNTSGNDWLVEADVNGDGIADLSILVTTSDADPLTAGDFVL